MEEYTEKHRMEGYIDFSVEKENRRVYREAKNGMVYRLLCRESTWKSTQRGQRMYGYIDFSVEREHGRVYKEAKNGRVYRLLCRERTWKSIQRSNEWRGI